MEQGTGVISQNDLMKKLAQAKKVMNKVETGDYEKGHVNEEYLLKSPEEINLQNLPTTQRKVGAPNVEKINQSKLPDAIKRAMIEHPIVPPEYSLSEGIDSKIIKGAKRLIEQENPQSARKQSNQPSNGASINEIVTALTPIIENSIRKIMDEKLTQLLTAQKTQSINENLVLKVGDSIFKGKITGVQNSK